MIREFTAERTRYASLLAGVAPPALAGVGPGGAQPIRGAAN